MDQTSGITSSSGKSKPREEKTSSPGIATTSPRSKAAMRSSASRAQQASISSSISTTSSSSDIISSRGPDLPSPAPVIIDRHPKREDPRPHQRVAGIGKEGVDHDARAGHG